MTNHPNRNWRARMHAAADQFLESPEGHEAIGPGPPTEMSARRKAARAGYVSGYEAGRQSMRRPLDNDKKR